MIDLKELRRICDGGPGIIETKDLAALLDIAEAAEAAKAAPNVPWPVRAYAEWLDDCRNALDDNDVPMKNLRSWIMEEYGI